ncbi:MAG: hypothetical protein HZLCBSQH_002288 [Candidatus Fervidibacterota bacterium]
MGVARAVRDASDAGGIFCRGDDGGVDFGVDGAEIGGGWGKRKAGNANHRRCLGFSGGVRRKCGDGGDGMAGEKLVNACQHGAWRHGVPAVASGLAGSVGAVSVGVSGAVMAKETTSPTL